MKRRLISALIPATAAILIAAPVTAGGYVVPMIAAPAPVASIAAAPAGLCADPWVCPALTIGALLLLAGNGGSHDPIVERPRPPVPPAVCDNGQHTGNPHCEPQEPAPVPVPLPGALLAGGLLGLGLRRRIAVAWATFADFVSDISGPQSGCKMPRLDEAERILKDPNARPELRAMAQTVLTGAV